jgi:hypothetical protein
VTGIAARYGRSAVSTSKISPVVMIRGVQADLVSREATGIAFAVQPLMMRAGDRGEFAKRADTDRIASERAECMRMTFHSASSSLPGLSRMALLTPSLPMSCSSAARLSQRRRSAVNSSCSAIHIGKERHALAVPVGVGTLGADHCLRAIQPKVAPSADRFTVFSISPAARPDGYRGGQRSSNALVSMAAIKDAISIVAKLQKLSETA